MKVLIFCMVMMSCITAFAQVITYDDYIASVLQNHPMVKKANLELEYGEIAKMKAKGAFDPKLYVSHDAKQFKNNEYYNILDGSIKVPTKFGLQFKANYLNTRGKYLNPQLSTDKNGVWSAGVELDVIQGLLVNPRSTAKELAKVYQDLSKVKQKLLLNELLYLASVHYVEWSTKYKALLTLQKNIKLSNAYLDNTVEMVKLGDKPGMDSLEAKTNLLSQQALLAEYKADYVKAKWYANQFLWENDTPRELLEGVIPMDLTRLSITPLASSIENNVMLKEKVFKLKVIEVERKLLREQTKPKLTLMYYPLLKTKSNFLPVETNLSYLKYGAKLSMPIFRYKSRSEYKKLKVKQLQTELYLLDKRNQLTNKQKAMQAKLEAYREQYSLTEELVQRTQQLLENENTKFEYGESSVFLLNKRQEKVIKTELKRIKIQQKILTSQLEYNYLMSGM